MEVYGFRESKRMSAFREESSYQLIARRKEIDDDARWRSDWQVCV